ncbi:non-hydrolyzing UDP-N-acetylglucosamine 2-epimerase [Virgibacillus alimentarius]|uniref:non-hydrolyzing UDP-N-acetylglucosamine 2-epimerase n=1 Tax=Virgibacillus alimentarius TaxID=698769 RepID=UPI0004932B36|nr:UDP-N-acetylglucosamine 2-epimerase (non-hydrolyzing) [Virgibacillus alimentarius]
MKILTVVGARPQFIKACMISDVLKTRANADEVIVHTGQHYDDNMSSVFFKQLELPKPDHYLGVGSASPGKQIGRMLEKLERIMVSVRPDIVLVYGDTNSTLAGSFAAANLHIPIAHVEAGLRSFNKKMPEERNRILTDHLSDWLFCPTPAAVKNLGREGIHRGVYQTGDIMYDVLLHFKSRALQQSNILKELSLSPKHYDLTTIHRAENTDDPGRLKAILKALQQLKRKVVFPLHPRTKQKIQAFGLTHMINHPSIKTTKPLRYFDLITIASEANTILTDSGGLQKESYMLKVPCVTLRDETEWTETVETGWNHLAGADPKKIIHTVQALKIPQVHPPLFGDGKTAEKICTILERS